MAVSEFVTFTINVNNSGVSQEGFGTALIVSYNAAFSDRVRSYSQYADVLDDFAEGTPEALAANALFSQSPHPTTVKIGRGTLKPTLKHSIGVITVSSSHAYTVQVDGPGITSTEASYTSDSSATAQEIHNGLVTALNAVVGKNYLATFAPMTYTGGTFTAANATEIFTRVAHGLLTGDGPVQVSNSGGALPAGLSAVTDYYVIKIDADTFYLATSLANALAGTHLSISTDGTGTQTIAGTASTVSPFLPFLVTATAAGGWFSLEVGGNAQDLSNKMTHTDPGIATDLAAIALADSDWYCLLTQYNSRAMCLAAAGWVESAGRIYMCSVPDTDALNTSLLNDDTLDALHTLGYKRTLGKYHSSPLECFAAASAGRILPLQPGKWTEAFKTLSGVSAMSMTSTQRANLRLRRAGTYTTEKGRSITWDGKVFDTVYGYLDIVVATDWLADQCQSAAFGVIVSLDKVAYTDEDIDLIAGAIRGVLHDATSDAHQVLDPGDPADDTNLPPSIVFPKVADIAAGTRALRSLPNGVITGRLQGAVQSVAFLATLTF
jgi:Protein of unknown function (DUF3383)